MPGCGAVVGGLGEAGVLRVLERRFATVPAAGDWPEGTVGPGDDAAVVAAPDGRFVITTDAMAQDRDFRLRWPAEASRRGARADFAAGHATGWKAAAQNLSDVNAMGATPTGILLALTMPGRTPVAWVDGLAAGIAGAVRHLGARDCRVVGGDLGSDDRITLAITATGDLGGRPPVRRTLPRGVPADRPVDLVLCGHAGWSAAGLAVLDTPRAELLERLGAGGTGSSAAPAPGPGVHRLAALAAGRQWRPRPVLGSGRVAARAGALAMMDVSDGVLKDAGRLAAANGRRVELDPEWIRAEAAVLEPLARALGADAGDWVAAGGEDYGLLAVLPAGTPPPAGFRRIGRLLLGSPGAPDGVTGAPAGGGGWDHF
ncbi:thiamine-monophosphate kinase [Citricoccus sp. SGAir0253]|uniref:thiamine-phosphate kinase n=1 Tax=Citricoccus sp. SGAir0253 TaxID=2567881 RepID=UPI001FEDAA43|nr:AIR synthase related protein [Citricoccus sp. SGAir0253]